MFRVEVRARPDLGCRRTNRRRAPPSAPPAGPPVAVVVHVFPYLCEQGRHGEQATAEAARSPLPTLATVFPDVTFHVESQDAAALVASSLGRFLRSSWARLAPVNVIVTHGNFLRNELLLPAGLDDAALANASVLEVDVETHGERKKLFLLRHCVSHHNASRRGSSRWTTCASVEALRCLASDLGASAPLYGSSYLPRAAISAVALQRDVTPEELEHATTAFRSARATPSEVAAYVARGACTERSPLTRRNSYCSAGRGTFIL
jgi:broad specificity phosphatase PhoE